MKVTVENGRSFVADAAIVAAPLGVLKAKAITFEPKLPEWKETAIADLGIGIENKIVLHFEKVFWPNVEFLGVVADTSYGCSYFLNLHKATGHSVLVYMPAGQLAKDIEKMSDEAAANFAYIQLKRILPNASAPVRLPYMDLFIYLILKSMLEAFDRVRVSVLGGTMTENIYFMFEPHRSSILFLIGARMLTHLAPTAMIQ